MSKLSNKTIMAHASPIISGWVWRKSLLGLGTARRQFAVLDNNKTMYFYSVKPMSPVEASDNLRLKLTSDDITEIELLEDKTIVLGCKFRVYEMRSENGDLEAVRWVEALREAIGMEKGDSRSAGGGGGRLEENGIPWMVDGAWLDEMLPAPLTMVTKVNLSPKNSSREKKKKKHSAHVRLADGSTFTVEGLEVGGESKEVASAGNKQLIAHLEKEGGTSKEGKKEAGAMAGLFTSINQVFAHAPVACAATMLVIRHWPNLHASDKMLYAIIAIYIVGMTCFVTVKTVKKTKGGDKEVGEEGISLVLQSSNLKPEQINEGGIADEPPELTRTASARGRAMSSLTPVKLSSPDTIDHQAIHTDLLDSGVNFSGDYQLNLKESGDPTEVRKMGGMARRCR